MTGVFMTVIAIIINIMHFMGKKGDIIANISNTINAINGHVKFEIIDRALVVLSLVKINLRMTSQRIRSLIRTSQQIIILVIIPLMRVNLMQINL